jgi:hypothetical protein
MRSSGSSEFHCAPGRTTHNPAGAAAKARTVALVGKSQAQTPPSPSRARRGSRRGFVGRVVTLTDDTLALETGEPVAHIAIARVALTSTERRLPSASRGKHALVGSALGLIGGATIGAIGGAAGSRPCAVGFDDKLCGRGFGATLGALEGGVLGLIAGTIIGIAIPFPIEIVVAIDLNPFIRSVRGAKGIGLIIRCLAACRRRSGPDSPAVTSITTCVSSARELSRR